MKRNLIAGALAFLLMAGLAGCSSPAQEKTLKIGTMPTETASIYAVGIEEGIFKKHNLNVELTIFSSAIERDAAATAGTLDGFLTDVMGVVNLNENNYPYKITSSEYENFSILAGPKETVTSPDQLGNLKLGLSNNTVAEFMADTLLKGVPFEKVNLPKVPDRFAALMSGEINAAIFPEPFSSMAEGKGSRRLISSAENNLQPVVFVFSEKALEDPAQVKNFYKAYNEIVKFMQDTPYDDYKADLVKHKIVTAEMIDTIKLPVDQYSAAKSISPSDFEKVLTWMKDKGMSKSEHTYDSLVEQDVLK